MLRQLQTIFDLELGRLLLATLTGLGLAVMLLAGLVRELKRDLAWQRRRLVHLDDAEHHQ